MAVDEERSYTRKLNGFCTAHITNRGTTSVFSGDCAEVTASIGEEHSFLINIPLKSFEHRDVSVDGQDITVIIPMSLLSLEEFCAKVREKENARKLLSEKQKRFTSNWRFEDA